MTAENTTTTNALNPDGGPRGSAVTGWTSLGTEISATLLRLTRYVAIFEIYTPVIAIRASEVIADLQIVVRDQPVYKGRAVVMSVLDVGSRFVCEVSLEESYWNAIGLSADTLTAGRLKSEFDNFLTEWQKLYRVVPEFKVVVADMQTYLSELQLWLEQVELKLRPQNVEAGPGLDPAMIDELAEPVIRSIDALIDKFETIVGELEVELQPVHRGYLRRHLHPLLLASPFANRAFRKPLGYAGDYEMVDMMLRPSYEGASLFAKILNVWLLRQAPAEAHRNRVIYLYEKLVAEAVRVRRNGKGLRVFNLGCGPAVEVQQFLNDSDYSAQSQFTLVDFNEETLRHLKEKLDLIIKNTARATSLQIVKKSVQRLLKESLKSDAATPEKQYDLVYCAGLFDYLPQPLCKRLMNIFYGMVAPGGLLLATNVSDVMNASRPFRYSMEYILDWHLIYRDRQALEALTPDHASPDGVAIIAESTGVNVFIEVRKPGHH